MSNQVANIESVSLEASTWTKVSKSGKETVMGLGRVIDKGTSAQRKALAMQVQHKLADNQNWKAVMTDVMAVFPPSGIKAKFRTTNPQTGADVVIATAYSKAEGALWIEETEGNRKTGECVNAGTKVTKALALRYFECIVHMADEKDQAGKPYKGEKLAYADFARDRLSIEAARKAEVAAQIAAKQTA